MAEILKLQDPVLAVIAYLRDWVPGVTIEPPSGWTWDALLVTVQDAGGTGERDVALDDVLISVTVSHPDLATASDKARELHGLLRAWPNTSQRVYWNGTVQRPTFDPDPETRTPAYSFTVRLIFRAEQVTVSP